MTPSATLNKGVGRQENKGPVDYTDALGHINMGTAARHRQKPDSVYRDHYESHPDPLLENATIEEIDYEPLVGHPGRREWQRAKNAVANARLVALGDSSAAREARVYPDFGNDRSHYEKALPKTRPFADVRAPQADYGMVWLVPATIGMLFLLFWVLDQL